jgi:hypothetical protein
VLFTRTLPNPNTKSWILNWFWVCGALTADERLKNSLFLPIVLLEEEDDFAGNN